MFELALVVGFGFLAYRATSLKHDEIDDIPRKVGDKIGKLWDIAHQGMRENRFLRAEKALLTILKIDQKNAAAYNRLGILYAKQKEYKDAIDCFEIASSIEPTASSLHNLGLIYYETENYQKAATAFEQALKLEEELAARHIAYAKVQEKLGNTKLMLQGLERAVELEPNKESYALLKMAYDQAGHEDKALEIEQKVEKLVIPAGKPKRIQRPKRRVVI
jgi:tetratricopeptide (TPR) repeat protein